MSSPSPPSPYAGIGPATQVAGQQQQLNTQMLEEVQAASNVNQETPYGSLEYTQSGTGPGGVPRWTAKQTLTPQQQAILDAIQGAGGAAATGAKNALVGAHYGETNPSDVVGGMTSGLTKDLLSKEVSYLSPQFTNQTEWLDNQLRNQGIMPGTPAYQAQMRDLQDNQNRTVTGFLATAEPAAFQQSVQSYMLPATTAGALETLGQPSQVNQTLTNTPTASGQPANLIGAYSSAQSAAEDQYKAQVAQNSAMMSGLFGLAGAGISGGSGGYAASPLAALIAASDRKLKKDIILVGKADNGLNLYNFRFRDSDDWQVGFMADEVEKIRPEAVVQIGDFKLVNYELAMR